MLVKKYISEGEFIDEFKNSQYKNNYSFEGLKALYEYLDDFDEEVDLDIIAIACDWSEYNVCDLQKYYGMDLETIKEHTMVLETSDENKVVILAF